MVKTESSVVSFSASVLFSTTHGLLIHLHEVGTSICVVTKIAEVRRNTQEEYDDIWSKTNNESKNQSGRISRNEFCLWGQNAQISPFGGWFSFFQFALHCNCCQFHLRQSKGIASRYSIWVKVRFWIPVSPGRWWILIMFNRHDLFNKYKLFYISLVFKLHCCWKLITTDYDIP